MTYLTLDCNKLLSIDDLCLVGLSKVYISIEPELAKKINLNLEELNYVEKCNNSTDFEPPFVDREYLKSRMICCNVLQQALRWKPKPNSLFITKLVKALNTNSCFNRFPMETTMYNGEYFYTQSPGIPRMLSTVTSPKSELKNPSEVLQKEVGLSSDELNSLVNSQTEFLSNVSVLGSLMKTMSNLSDLNMGLLCEALSVPYDFLLLPELQKIPNVMETVRNLLWLTEDSKLIPKKGGDKTIKSLVSTQLVHNAELRSLAQSVLKEVSKVFSSLCSNQVQPELQNVVNKAWSASLDTQLNALLYSLKNVTVLYNELLPLMFSKYSESYNHGVQNSIDGLGVESLEKSMNKYNELFVSFRERWDNMPKPTLTSLECLADLYNDFATLSLCVSVNLLNLKELNDQKMHEKKAKSNKQGQKSVLGHGNELYKNFLDKEVCKGVKYCDSGAWDIISRSLTGSGLLNLCNRFDALLVPQNQKTRLPKLPKGTMDFCPNEVLTRRIVISSIKDIFRQHGAVEIETPVFELKETLLGKYGEDQKLIFDLKDQGGEQLSLRYDLTVPFARFVAMNKMEKIKRFHIGKVYRRDEPQLAKGRYREFYQCDLDCAGEYPKMVPDSEVIFILVRVLRLLKGGCFAVRINHRAILDSVLFHCGVEVSMHRTICSSIDKLDKVPWDKVKLEMTNEKGLPEYIADKIKEFIEINGTFKEVLGKLRDKNIKTLTKDNSDSNVLDDMELLWSYLEAFGVKETEVMFDMSLARGLEYYTGVIFEAFLKDEDVGSVGAGGRYDGLIGMFSGKNVPSVGMSVGIERLFRTMPKHNSGDLTDVFVCSVGSPQMFFERMKLVGMLWSHGIRAEFLYNTNANLRKQLDAATDKGVSVMVLVGDSELETDTVKIKRLSYNEEERLDDLTVKRSEMISTLKSLLSDNTKYDKLTKTLFNTNNL